MNAKKVLVCLPQIPFVRGGAEVLVDRLVDELGRHEFSTDTVTIPFHDWPHETLVQSACMWRMVEFERFYNSPDFVIATKFPSYFLQHRNKIVWLFHNYRQVYDLYGTPYSGYSRMRPDDIQLVQWIVEHDKEYLAECRKIFTISGNVRNRLRRFLDIDAEVLYPPPPLEGRFYCEDYQPFILVVQRLDPYKRTDLLLQSLEFIEGDYAVKIVGRGPDEKRLKELVTAIHLQHRVQFLGQVSEEELLQLYARCRVVFYAPYDEDYGFTTLEAFLSKKPVITANDSGGTLEFVEHLVNGWIADPQPSEIAAGLQTILDQPDLAQKLGNAGYPKAEPLNWKNTIGRFKQIFAEVLN